MLVNNHSAKHDRLRWRFPWMDEGWVNETGLVVINNIYMSTNKLFVRGKKFTSLFPADTYDTTYCYYLYIFEKVQKKFHSIPRTVFTDHYIRLEREVFSNDLVCPFLLV
jgi:hypothetical protein